MTTDQNRTNWTAENSAFDWAVQSIELLQNDTRNNINNKGDTDSIHRRDSKIDYVFGRMQFIHWYSIGAQLFKKSIQRWEQ